MTENEIDFMKPLKGISIQKCEAGNVKNFIQESSTKE